MVPQPPGDPCGLPTAVTPDSTPDNTSIRSSGRISTSILTAVSCMARLRERYRASGLSEVATLQSAAVLYQSEKK